MPRQQVWAGEQAPRIIQPGARTVGSYRSFEGPEHGRVPEMPLTKGLFVSFGLPLLLGLCLFPVWDSLALLENFNYVFWEGKELPLMVITACCLIVILFLFSAESMFASRNQEQRDAQSVGSVASFFFTILGLVLVLVSMPMSSRALSTSSRLQLQCQGDSQMRNIQKHYDELLALRTKAACAALPSVEECDGFKAVTPYTAYLKDMENGFKCSGFCHSQATPILLGNNATAGGHVELVGHLEALNDTPEPWGSRILTALTSSFLRSETMPASDLEQDLVATEERTSKRGTGNKLKLRRAVDSTSSDRPPALFSSSTFQVSCDGAAARDMLYTARDTGSQNWYLGIALITLSVIMGLWEWGSVTVK